MRKGWERLPLFLAGSICGIMVSAGAERTPFERPPADATLPVEFTEMDKSGPLPPTLLRQMNIDLHIVKSADFERHNQKYGMNAWSGAVLGTKDRNCQIYIPTNLGLLYAYTHANEAEMVQSGAIWPAAWDNPHANQALAHEILHCLRGLWHG